MQELMHGGFKKKGKNVEFYFLYFDAIHFHTLVRKSSHMSLILMELQYGWDTFMCQNTWFKIRECHQYTIQFTNQAEVYTTYIYMYMSCIDMYILCIIYMYLVYYILCTYFVNQMMEWFRSSNCQDRNNQVSCGS